MCTWNLPWYQKHMCFKKLENQIGKFKQLLVRWDLKKITLHKEMSVVKSLALPILTLNLSVLVVPKSILNQIQRMIFNFIWGNNHKIKLVL